MEHLEALNHRLSALTVFRNLWEDELMRRFRALLLTEGKPMPEKLSAYSAFAASVLMDGEDLTACVWERVSSDENFLIRKCARGEAISPALTECLASELETLREFACLTAQSVREGLGYKGYLPEWRNHPADFPQDYKRLLSNVATKGYGQYSRHTMFTVSGGSLAPVHSPDQTRLCDLKGYERERKTIVDNTRSLLEGKPSANTLLYGDAGTGKSSTIKAVVNEFADQGLRLIEIRKSQLSDIPRVTEALKSNPLKFILFIDDLSFAQHSEEIGVMKAILEGTVSARTKNVVIYATSNRRHIVNERFSDRGDDDIHRNETIQEQVSLSQRFGLAVSFLKPDKARYLEIVRALCQQYGLPDIEELDLRAERYAIERGGRSPRVARQFVDGLRSAER